VGDVYLLKLLVFRYRIIAAIENKDRSRGININQSNSGVIGEVDELALVTEPFSKLIVCMLLQPLAESYAIAGTKPNVSLLP
jgi:hypothetical protein